MGEVIHAQCTLSPSVLAWRILACYAPLSETSSESVHALNYFPHTTTNNQITFNYYIISQKLNLINALTHNIKDNILVLEKYLEVCYENWNGI